MTTSKHTHHKHKITIVWDRPFEHVLASSISNGINFLDSATLPLDKK